MNAGNLGRMDRTPEQVGKETLFKAIRDLKLVFTEKPQPELLIRLPNTGGRFEVEHGTLEFTSLCPLNLSQPDYAKLSIRLMPDEWLVELKSLKFYLTSFRMVPIFHEEVAPLLMNTLYDLLNPFYIQILGEFSIRGGLATTATCRRLRPGWDPTIETQ